MSEIETINGAFNWLERWPGTTRNVSAGWTRIETRGVFVVFFFFLTKISGILPILLVPSKRSTFYNRRNYKTFKKKTKSLLKRRTRIAKT